MIFIINANNPLCGVIVLITEIENKAEFLKKRTESISVGQLIRGDAERRAYRIFTDRMG